MEQRFAFDHLLYGPAPQTAQRKIAHYAPERHGIDTRVCASSST